MSNEIHVSDIMTEHVITLNQKTPLKDVVHIMLRDLISGVPIVDDSGKLQGIITLTDLFVILGKMIKSDSPNQKTVPVQEVMTTNVRNIRPDLLVREVVQISVDNNIHCFPVVDEEANIVGILGKRDILNAGYSLLD